LAAIPRGFALTLTLSWFLCLFPFAGLSSGALHLYDVSPDLYTPTREGTERFYEKINYRIAMPR
jgi:hypothetical protein